MTPANNFGSQSMQTELPLALTAKTEAGWLQVQHLILPLG
jgi:hypothetical protein